MPIPLIKTAIAGSPNCKELRWAGAPGEIVDQKLKIKIGNFVVAENGKISETYNEQKLKEYMQ